MPMSDDVNKKDLLMSTLKFTSNVHTYEVFAMVVCCFTRNTLSTFSFSDQIIAKNNTFSK